MGRGNTTLARVLCLAALAGGCASTKPPALIFKPAQIDPTRVVAKVDAFVIDLDASTSMAEPYNPQRKLDVAHDLTAAMVATIPELDYRAGLRSFGQGCCLPRGGTSLLYGMVPHSQSAAGAAVNQVRCAGGPTPLSSTLTATGSDLADAVGARTNLKAYLPTTSLPAQDAVAAVVVVSDGLHLGKDEVAAARALKGAWGDRLCLWAVQVGDSPEGHAMLQKIVDVGGCGRLVTATDLTNPAKLELLVRDAILYPDSDGDGVPDHLDRCPDTPSGTPVNATGCPPDEDGDGVPDFRDRCPGTPKGVSVDVDGCPLDSDGDGVPDYLDTCPDTPRGAKVDSNGCPEAKPVASTWTSPGNVLFDFDRYAIRADARPTLDQVVSSLVADPVLRLLLEGHTDAIGSDEYNLKLSVRRADAVKAYLVAKGVDGTRLTTTGLGESKPVSPNDTSANRQLNRRVELKTP